MIFRLTGSLRFEAENIDDAFAVLARHFTALSKGDFDSEIAVDGTDISITPDDA